jgi:hypothetical protein
MLGIRFYSDLEQAPLIQTLNNENIQQIHRLFRFSDSSWNDDIDHGQSTGCFIIKYMGGIIDHSSNLPGLVALSSAELEGTEEENMNPTTFFFDSKSAIAMGKSFRDTKHT